MSSTTDLLIKNLAKTITETPGKKSAPYDTQAEVRRIEGDIAWVHIPGGVDETPVQLTTNAKKGDIVQVRVSGGQAWITGNATSPPTDDTKANEAQKTAAVADEHATDAVTSAMLAQQFASEAQAAAEIAKETTDEINGYAETAGKTVTEILNDGETAGQVAQQAKNSADSAGQAAQQAKNSADSALVSLSQVESVLDVVEWCAKHGVYVKTTDVAINPNKTYYTVTATTVSSPSGSPKEQGYYILSSGTYIKSTDTSVVAGTTYYELTGTPVTNPVIEDIGTYYELTIDDAMADYINTHLALTDDGLYVMADGTDWKVLVASDGIYIIDDNGNAVAKYKNATTIGLDDGTQSYLEIDYHSIQFKDSEGDTYFWVSDAKDAEGYLTETFEGDGTTTEFNLQNGLRNDHSFVVKINGVETTAFSHIGVSPKFVFNTAPLAGDVITIKYLPSWYNSSPTYTFGKRKSGSNNGIWSVVEGTNTVASGACSHAEGTNTVASGACSHAEGGHYTTASGNHSHAEGDYSVASGYGSHAEGFTAKAEGSYSHAQGYQTKATQKAQMVMGSYNVGDVSPSVAVHPSGDTSFGNYAVIVGNGTADDARSNALTVDWNGNVNIPSGSSYQVDGVPIGGGSASGTPIPTADTNAQFDSDAHMNSTDMTTQEVEDFVDGLNVSGGGFGLGVESVRQNCTFISGKSYVDISYTLPTGATILIMALNGRPNADWIYADISAYGTNTARVAYNNTYSSSLSGDVVLNILYKK